MSPTHSRINSGFVGPEFVELENILDQLKVGLQQTIICQHGHESRTYFSDVLAVEVDEQSTSLQMCLESFFLTERLSNCTCGTTHDSSSTRCTSFKCDMCNRYVGGQKLYRISFMPDIHMVQLKLFRFERGGQVSKINN